MSIFLDQIEKRKLLEEATLAETFEKGTRRMGLGSSKRHAVTPSDNSALRSVLDALGVTGYEFSNNDMTTPEEQLTAILQPKGIRHCCLRDGASATPSQTRTARRATSAGRQ